MIHVSFFPVANGRRVVNAELRPPDRETTVESDVPAKRKQKRDSEEECGDLKELPKLPFELRPSPLMYTRRVEGVIDPDEMPSVLEGAPV